MNLFYVFCFFFALVARAETIEFEVTSKWFRKNTKEELSTLIFVRPNEMTKVSLEPRPFTSLHLTVLRSGNEITLKSKIVDTKMGKETVHAESLVKTSMGKKARINGKFKESDESVQIELTPSGIEK